MWANVDSNKDPQEVNKRLVKIHSKCLVEKEDNRWKKRIIPYRWNTDIENARKECTAARRQVTRCKNRQEYRGRTREELQETYRNKKKALRRQIEASKRAHWKQIYRELEDDIWGKGYEIATRNIRGRQMAPYAIPEERSRAIVKALFPNSNDKWDRGAPTDQRGVPLFNFEELRKAGSQLKSRESSRTGRTYFECR